MFLTTCILWLIILNQYASPQTAKFVQANEKNNYKFQPAACQVSDSNCGLNHRQIRVGASRYLGSQIPTVKSYHHFHTYHHITLYYITTLASFQMPLTLILTSWPAVHQQSHVIWNTAHRPRTQASYTAGRVSINQNKKLSCSVANCSNTHNIIPWWCHRRSASYTEFNTNQSDRELNNNKIELYSYIFSKLHKNKNTIP